MRKKSYSLQDKTFYFLFFLSLLILSAGCSQSELEPVYNMNPPYDYQLLISIQDIFGNDRLNEIPFEDIVEDGSLIVEDKDGWVGSVQSDLYTLEIIAQELCFEFKGVFPERIDTPLPIVKVNNGKYLFLRASSSRLCPPEEQITFKLSCPFLFGDNKTHTIVTYWSPDGLVMPLIDGVQGPDSETEGMWWLRNECYLLSIDGKEWHVVQEEFYHNLREETIMWIEQNERDERFYISRYASVAHIVLP